MKQNNAAPATSSKVRVSNPCDGCTIRRVRCEATRPCRECQKRCIPCTTFRARQKRGPKGPRSETSHKVLEFQRSFVETHAASSSSPSSSVTVSSAAAPTAESVSADSSGSGPGSGAGSLVNEPRDVILAAAVDGGDMNWELATKNLPPGLCPASSGAGGRLPIQAYHACIDTFRRRLFPVWPVVDCEALSTTIACDPDDMESWALAAAVCAATIAQLRLSEHAESASPGDPSALQFAQDSLHFRSRFEYLESYSIPSMLTSFFLHMYYANALKLRTAGFYMREAVTYAHGLQLDHPETYKVPDSPERSFKLRLYWILLISERTYCAQNGMPAVLETIDEKPPFDDHVMGVDDNMMKAFISLIRLFTCLKTEITGTSTGPSDRVIERARLARYQVDLSRDVRDPSFDEIQRVDLFVTRQWIRLLVWEYTVRHHALSSNTDDPGFFLLFPVVVAREMLSVFASVNVGSIRAHGYGMELKVYRTADLLIDILACSTLARSTNRMLVGAEEILQSLSHVLFTVGGIESDFLSKTRARMGELELARGSLLRTPVLAIEDGYSDDTPPEHQEQEPRDYA